jgi:hypothetical protein
MLHFRDVSQCAPVPSCALESGTKRQLQDAVSLLHSSLFTDTPMHLDHAGHTVSYIAVADLDIWHAAAAQMHTARRILAQSTRNKQSCSQSMQVALEDRQSLALVWLQTQADLLKSRPVTGHQ